MAYDNQITSVSQRITIDHHEYFVENVPGDGNSFFHCLSMAIYGDYSRTREYRNIVCHTIFNNWEDWHEKVELFHGPLMTTHKHTVEV